MCLLKVYTFKSEYSPNGAKGRVPQKTTIMSEIMASKELLDSSASFPLAPRLSSTFHLGSSLPFA